MSLHAEQWVVLGVSQTRRVGDMAAISESRKVSTRWIVVECEKHRLYKSGDGKAVVTGDSVTTVRFENIRLQTVSK